MAGAAESEQDHTNGRPPGRPRDAAIDELVLRATLDLLAERGMEATTIQAVSDRTGIARATIYLRWPGRSALILARPALGGRAAALRAQWGYRHRLRARRRAGRSTSSRSRCSSPRCRPSWARSSAREGSAPDVTFDTLFPNRRRLIDVIPAPGSGAGLSHRRGRHRRGGCAAGRPVHAPDHDRASRRRGRSARMWSPS